MRRRPGRWASLLDVAAVCTAGLLFTACHESPTNAPPTVVLTQAPNGQAIAGVTAVVFTATADDRDGDDLSLSWELGDGGQASGASVVHVYARTGVFPVTLTASDGHGGSTAVGSSITVGSLSGRWLLSRGGEQFYERGFDITQAGEALRGWPYATPDRGCVGELHGVATSPRAVRFEFRACDGETVVVQGVAAEDLRSITGTYTHPDPGSQAMVLTRE